MIRLAIVTTHPIQYQVPWFRALAANPSVDLTVFFALLPDARQQGDGFGVCFEWDIPLLEGYTNQLLENVARCPGVDHFTGCDTPAIGTTLAGGHFDAVIVNGWVVKTCLQTLWACRRLGIPCLVRGESNALRHRATWKRWLHRLLLSQYAACLCIGQANRNFYLANGVPAARLFSVPYGVDNQRFAHTAAQLRPQRQAIRASWSIPPQAVVALFCAKFIAKKRPLDLLVALSLLQASGANQRLGLHLLMVGSGELLESCRAFALQHHLPVTFTGFLNQSEMPRAYVAADLQVLPSDDGETWGLVINEGMACGLPALVSDSVGCHPDLLEPGVTGDVFPLGDTVALAERLERLCSCPDQLASMGQAARLRVAAYGIDQMVDGTLQALSSVTGSH